MANNHDAYDRELLRVLQSIARSLKVIASDVEDRQTKKHFIDAVNGLNKEE